MRTIQHHRWRLLLGLPVLVAVTVSSLRGDEDGHDGDHDHAVDHNQRAFEVWSGFVEHLRAIDRADLIPEYSFEGLEESEDDDTEETDDETDIDDSVSRAALKLESSDPIRGTLFRLSGDLIDLDALFQEAAGASLTDVDGKKASELTAKLKKAEDPYLRLYGDFYGARLDLETEEYAKAVEALERLVESPRFLPRRQAQRYLASAYRGVGDDTLALLELQLFLTNVPPEEATERDWAKEELRQIREKSQAGPLEETGKRMTSISTLLADNHLGESTQGEQQRVEEIFTKVVELLEAPRCPSCGTPKCKRCGGRRCPCKTMPGT